MYAGYTDRTIDLGCMVNSVLSERIDQKNLIVTVAFEVKLRYRLNLI